MRIAILGGGHGCYAAAADLSEQGHSIALWRRNAGQFAALGAAPELQLKDARGERRVPIDTVTDDIGVALRDAMLVLMFTPAFAQEEIARAMAPHLVDGQVLFLAPGTLGSVLISRTLLAHGCRARVALAETGTLPYLARKHGEAQVTITMRAVRLPVGVLPARATSEAMAVIASAYPCVHPIEDALSAALMNAGPIIHPPLILMNAGPLEHFERWDIHAEGTQPAIRRVTDALDRERIELREAFGYSPNHYPLRDHYESDRWMYGDAHARLVDSGDWREHIVLDTHRYMTEDVAHGLGLMVSAAAALGAQVPIAAGLLALGRAVCGGSFRYGERSFESLGLAGLNPRALATLLQEGLG